MAVQNDTILDKMMLELQHAKQAHQNQATMLKHIANIRLLCDLFLTEEEPATTFPAKKNSLDISAAELKAMMGKEDHQGATPAFKKSIELDDEDGNGKSIFDF